MERNRLDGVRRPNGALGVRGAVLGVVGVDGLLGRGVELAAVLSALLAVSLDSRTATSCSETKQVLVVESDEGRNRREAVYTGHCNHARTTQPV